MNENAKITTEIEQKIIENERLNLKISKVFTN